MFLSFGIEATHFVLGGGQMSKKAEILQKKIVEHGFDLTAQNTRFIISYQNMYYFEVRVSDLKDSIIRY